PCPTWSSRIFSSTRCARSCVAFPEQRGDRGASSCSTICVAGRFVLSLPSQQDCLQSRRHLRSDFVCLGAELPWVDLVTSNLRGRSVPARLPDTLGPLMVVEMQVIHAHAEGDVEGADLYAPL